MRRHFLLAGLHVLLAGCALTDVTLADPADVVVAEVVLRAGDPAQTAFLHRTLGTGTSLEVPGAHIVVTDADGLVMSFTETSLELCVENAPDEMAIGTCYIARNPPFDIEPLATYSIRIDLPGGGTLTGQTTVPGTFSILHPTPSICHLEPDHSLEIRWTRSDSAWVYVAETSIAGLRAALADRGVELKDEPARFVGLSVSAQDTTLDYPGEMGLFDRADPALADALIAIRDGLPPGVAAEIVVAAADRNYVNWARGGQFNPSGVIRIQSLTGAGTGVFGSIVYDRRTMLTTDDVHPACD